MEVKSKHKPFKEGGAMTSQNLNQEWQKLPQNLIVNRETVSNKEIQKIFKQDTDVNLDGKKKKQKKPKKRRATKIQCTGSQPSASQSEEMKENSPLSAPPICPHKQY
eukprot:13433315-Ditylum_brightwellii.AAC.1